MEEDDWSNLLSDFSESSLPNNFPSCPMTTMEAEQNDIFDLYFTEGLEAEEILPPKENEISCGYTDEILHNSLYFPQNDRSTYTEELSSGLSDQSFPLPVSNDQSNSEILELIPPGEATLLAKDPQNQISSVTGSASATTFDDHASSRHEASSYVSKAKNASIQYDRLFPRQNNELVTSSGLNANYNDLDTQTMMSRIQLVVKPPRTRDIAEKQSPRKHSIPTDMSSIGLQQLAQFPIVVPIRDMLMAKASQVTGFTTVLGEYLHRYVSTRHIVRDVAGMLSETVMFVADRAQFISDKYIKSPLTSDDPEIKHLLWIGANSLGWELLPLRCRLASLTWSQLQLVDDLAARTRLCTDRHQSANANTNGGSTLPSMQPMDKNSHANRRKKRAARLKHKEMPMMQAIHMAKKHESRAQNDRRSDEEDGDSDYWVLVDSDDDGADDEGDEDNSPPAHTANRQSVVHRTSSNRHGIVGEGKELSLQWWLATAAEEGDEDAQYELARFFCPPAFAESDFCHTCLRQFSFTLFRHHCRNCGKSFCSAHSPDTRRILRFGHITPVRVCFDCSYAIDAEAHANQLQWREMRVKALLAGHLIPYSRSAQIDRGVDKAMRIVDGSLNVVKATVILNYPTKIVIETIAILKRYGLSGLAGVLMRQDFLEAVELLKRISGMDKLFVMSLHELTACIYYKLAIDRGLRGCDPDGEHIAHMNHTQELKELHSQQQQTSSTLTTSCAPARQVDLTDDRSIRKDLENAIRIAPLALEAVYADQECDCQRIALSQGWTTVFVNSTSAPEQPAYAIFVTTPTSPQSSNADNRGEIVLAIRGTQTIQDIVTDIRAAPHRIPPDQKDLDCAFAGNFRRMRAKTDTFSVSSNDEGHAQQISTRELSDEDFLSLKLSQWEWSASMQDMAYGCTGMVRSAMWLLREVAPALLQLYSAGYKKIIVTGHSLGAGVGTFLTYMLQDKIPSVEAVLYACPSCCDAATADSLLHRVSSIVVHDDIVSRVTPQSIRLLLSDLMVFREQVFRHIAQDWNDVIQRAGTLWSPRWREVHGIRAHQETSPSSPGPCKSPVRDTFDTIPLADATDNGEEVLVEGEQLPELWLPGRLLHLYSYRGQYRVARVNREFPSVRKIEVQGNICSDHSANHVFEALLEARAVLMAYGEPPEWTTFDAVSVCQCCSAAFTWHSTFRGEAQEYRERYNCRHCGRLVCGPCSEKRVPIAKFGLLLPTRICDICFYKGDYAK